MLEFQEEVFDQVSLFIELFVVFSRIFSIGFWWDDGDFSGACKGHKDPFIRIIGFVCNEYVCLEFRQQCIGALQVVCLTGRQRKSGGIAERIADGMNLGGQPAFAPADGLSALFLRAPALC